MKLTLNLASRSYLDRRRVYFSYAAVLIVLGVLLVANIAALTRNQLQVRKLQTYLSDLGAGARTQGLEVSAEEVKQLQNEIAFANAVVLKDAFRWTALLNHLEEVVRQGITIRSLQPDYRMGNLKISGMARNLKDLRGFLDRIQESTHFDNVYLFDQSQVEIDDYAGSKRTVVSFSILLEGAF